MLTERPIEQISDLMKQALAIRQIPAAASDLIIEDYLGAQLQGRLTHGLGRFLLLDEARSERKGAPAVVLDQGAAALIDGRRELGQVVAAIGIDEVCKRAKQHGIAACGLINFSRYSRLGVLSGRIASAGYIAVVLNNAGPGAVAPFGGIDPILGTNPISFAFPFKNNPVVLDFATAERVWGEIRQAILEKRALPNEAFLDKDGKITVEPEKVSAVKAFGGARGYALCLAIEILAGVLVPAKVGLAVNNQFDLGALFVAIKPNLFGASHFYEESLEKLLSEIRTSRPNPGNKAVLVPGDRAVAAETRHRQMGTVEIDDTTYEHLKIMARDAQSGGLTSTRLTD
jgi:L-2-hydroxycarboxylate dehydrogenase (NAD+)